MHKLIAIVASAAVCTMAVASMSNTRKQRMAASPQYQDGTFVNTLPMKEDAWGFQEYKTMIMEWIGGDQIRVPKTEIDVVSVTAADVSETPDADLSIRWLGHSTMLMEIEGKRLLLDPVWSERASPVQFAGPKRFYAPPLALDDLPTLDGVVISHDHYDHLDAATIKKLAQRGVQFYVPLGIGNHLEDWGVAAGQITELDWWESYDLAGLEIVCTPARHFSGRGFSDRNETLWASWAFIGKQRRAFFSGDSGLFPGFSDIGDKYGPFDVTMLEVGAYNQLWADVHMGPEQAAIAHRALKGKLMLPIHWGLFNLAVHSWIEPAERLKVIAEQQGIEIAFPQPGGVVQVGQDIPVARWWPEIDWKTADQAPVVSTHLDPKWLSTVEP